MVCGRKTPSEEEKTIKFLLGPTKIFTPGEMKIISQASVCQVRRADAGEAIEPFNMENSDILFRPLTSFPKPWMRQTYKQWKALMDIHWLLSKIKKRKVIYIQPLDDFPDFISNFRLGHMMGFFEFLRSMCEVFFMGFQVRLLPKLNMTEAAWNIDSRIHKKTQQKQYLVTDLQKCLQSHIPKDGHCIIGITWTDLYPSEKLNFVLGNANAGLRSAALCFGRFEPKKFREGAEPPPAVDHINDKILWRMIKVITHETCHLLGMSHCKFFECAMNESTSMDEAMSQPFHLCPVCLRKLHKTGKFSLEERYRRILSLFEIIVQEYKGPKILESIHWLRRAINLMTGEDFNLNSTHL